MFFQKEKPRRLLEGIEEVEIKKENDVTTIMPTGQMNSHSRRTQLDPIWSLGKNPMECSILDASEQHDKYLYRTSSGTQMYSFLIQVSSLPLKLLTTKIIYTKNHWRNF